MNMPPNTAMPQPVEPDFFCEDTCRILEQKNEKEEEQKRCCDDEFEKVKKETDEKFQAIFEHIVTLQSKIVELESVKLATQLVPLKTPKDDQSNFSGLYQFPKVSPLFLQSPPVPSGLTSSTQFGDSTKSGISNIQYPFLMQPITSQATTTPKKSEKSKKKCSHCAATETCQWRRARSKESILCNACFVYQRKYKISRPLTVVQTYRNREDEKLRTTK